MADAQKMKNANNVPLALAKYQQALNIDPDNYDALWNASVLSADMGRRQRDDDVRDKYYKEAKRLADKAVRENENGADAHYARALAIDQYMEIVNTKEKIALMPEFKVSSMEALRLNPKMAGAWHMLGRWNYRISNLTLKEKTIYKTQLGNLPEAASNDYAARCFLNAIELEANVILFHHDLARVYNLMGNRTKTRESCLKCINLKNVAHEDPAHKADCADWLRNLGY